MIQQRLLIFLMFSFWTLVTHAQQDTQFSQYVFNPLFYNPATAGLTGNMRFAILHRTQWLSYAPTLDDGSGPTSQLFTFDMPLKIGGTHHGIGFHVVRDKIITLTNTEVQLSYAYHQRFQAGTLSLGIRGGIYNQAINFDLFRPVDEDDPLLQGGNQNQFKSDFAVGIHWQAPRYFIGTGFNHLGESSFSYDIESLQNTLSTHFNVIGGGNFNISSNILMNPSFLVKSDFNTLSYEGTVLTTFSEKYYGGISLRNSNTVDDVVFMLGTFLLKDKSLHIGYAFDYVLSGQTAKASTSHEVMLAYRLNAPKSRRQRPNLIIRTPRFRHE